MKPRIIFEGFDNTGKSTLAKHFGSLLDLPVFKNPAEKELFNGEEFNFLTNLQYVGPFIVSFLEQTLKMRDGIIFDRFLPSEFAYSIAYRRGTDLNLLRALDNKLNDLGFVTILCYKSTYHEFIDEVVKLEMADKVNEAYIQFTEWTSMPTLFLDTTDEDLRFQTRRIVQFLGDYA